MSDFASTRRVGVAAILAVFGLFITFAAISVLGAATATAASVTHGDCNADHKVDAGDLSALVLEIFDGDGSAADAVPGSTFAGHRVGCDANDDTAVDAADVSCTVLLTFDASDFCDQTAPTVLAHFPRPTRVVPSGAITEVLAAFDEPIDPTTLTSTTYRLFAAGPDGVTGTGDDVLVGAGAVSFREQTDEAVMTFGSALPVGLYRAVLGPTIADPAGNALGPEQAWTFRVKVAVYWISNSSGFWDVAANWSTGSVPQPGDFVVIDRPGNLTITHRQDNTIIGELLCEENLVKTDFGSLTISGTDGTSEINGNASLLHATGPLVAGGALVVNGAFLCVNATLTVNATVNLAGAAVMGDLLGYSCIVPGPGTLNTDGPLTEHSALISVATLNTNAAVTIDTDGNKSLVGTLWTVNRGAVWMRGLIASGQGAVINLPADQSLDIQGDVHLGFDCGICGVRPVLNLAGTLKKSAGAGEAVIPATVFQPATGRVEVRSGTLRLSGGGSYDGAIVGMPGATMLFDQSGPGIAPPHTVNAGTLVALDRLRNFAPTNIAATVSVTTTTTLEGGTLNLNGPISRLGTTLDSAGGTINVNLLPSTPPTTLWVHGGVLKLNFSDPMTVVTALLEPGNLQLTGPLTVSGGMTWTGAGIAGGTVNANGGVAISGGGHSLVGTHLNLNGGAVWSSGFIASGQGAVIDLPAGQTLDLQGDVSLGYDCGICGVRTVFNNAGLYKKSAGAGTANIGGPEFKNSGKVEALAGTISFSTSFVQSAGLIKLNGGQVAADNGLILNGGSLVGTGTVAGPLPNNAGAIGPGLSAGAITATGSFSQGASGATSMELGGLGTSQFDRLLISGAATLGGTLNLSLINGFVPNLGDSLQIMTFASRSGTFATVTGVTIGGGKKFQVNYNATDVTLAVVPDP